MLGWPDRCTSAITRLRQAATARGAAPERTAVLVKRDIAHPVKPVFDPPVTEEQPAQVRGVRLVRPQSGDVVAYLLLALAGLHLHLLPPHPADLTQVGPGGLMHPGLPGVRVSSAGSASAQRCRRSRRPWRPLGSTRVTAVIPISSD